MEDHKYRDILLWKMKVELTDLKMRAMELVRTIAELENEAAAVEIFQGPDSSEASKTLSYGRGTSSITIFADVDESEGTRSPSHGQDMSEVAKKLERTVDGTTTNDTSAKQNPRSNENNRLKHSYEIDSDLCFPAEEDSLSRIKFKPRKLVVSIKE